MQAHVYVGYNNEDIIYVESEGVWESGAPADHTGDRGEHSVSGDKGRVYLEELELERERWRLRPGDLERERRRGGDRLLGERDLLGHK